MIDKLSSLGVVVFYWNFSRSLIEFDVFGTHVNMSWYGLFFSLGFFSSAFSVMFLLKNRLLSHIDSNFELNCSIIDRFLEKFLFFLVIAVVLGARLGYVLFYGLPYYLKNFSSVFKIWEGGLSSHGGILGFFFFVAMLVRTQKDKIRGLGFFLITDIASATFGFTAFMIRLGNLFNREILGKPTDMPWGIVFLDSFDGSSSLPLHPVQLYEGLSYLITSIAFLIFLLLNPKRVGNGCLTGMACMAVSAIRFGLEFFKSHQGIMLSSSSPISMGQLLSLPLFLFGAFIFARSFFIERRSAGDKV